MDQHVVVMIFEFVVLVFAFSIHEAAHAWMAAKLGDPTAMMLGRVTLNPIKHIDLWGSVIVPILGIVQGGWLIGWAKPCPITPRNFRRYKRDFVLVALAGPAVNLLLAIMALLVLVVLKHATPNGELAVLMVTHHAMLPSDPSILFPIVMLLYITVLVNLSLFVFNLIPVPPLDGSRVLRLYLPHGMAEAYDRIGVYGFFLIFFVVPYITGFSLYNVFFDPALQAFRHMLLMA